MIGKFSSHFPKRFLSLSLWDKIEARR
jgi:hypothetical protein